ncbi:serine-rich adhesin for platelets-like isoform X1 [Sander lucioperca]|uniref:serine-rich adhesin for platelets-like isoform X1 n=2 Tax=Sander lucioperca TaxID=283035 RepID=UPI0016534DC6|nr:serine-rich adhesin for platelets-like isoform X1 [Sander lucioperca]
MSVWSLYSSISRPLLILSPSFSHSFPLGGEGAEKRRGSVVKSVSLASLAPPTSVEALHTAAARALSNGASATEPRQQSSTATACRVSPMELPLGGPALRHYTQSRPRPHRQKLNYRPSRSQETIIESDNKVLQLMGRVDEGVEEFFTKRVLPTDTLNKQDEESITVHEVAPASSVPCPPPTKTLRRKLGDFFTLKKRRGLKSETSQEGRPKKASIADLIRPLREVARAEKEKDKDKVKEHDKENEKEKMKEHPSAVTGESAVQEPAPLRGETVPPRRALREGKSQSLILLSGSAAAGTTNARNTSKKQFEGQHSFEQKLHLMLQRIGVSKVQPGETQNQEGEMKKAESEGTIIDSKPEPPPTYTKPRTMSASSDTRHQIRPSVSAHESAGKPALLPKPLIKPGPPPTTSGRNTPENELAQIQEGETNTPTKLSPTAALSTPATAVPTTTTTPTVLTISNSVPDSTNIASTVPPSDTAICADSVNPAAASTTPTNVTETDSKPSIPEANATITDYDSTFPTTLTSTTTPTEPPTTVLVTSTFSESMTPSLSVISNSTTITMPSITTSETVSAPSNESSVSTTSTNLSTKSTFPDPNGVPSIDGTPAAGGDAAISVITTASSPSTSISDVPPGLSAPANSVTEACYDSTSVTSTSSVPLASSVTKTTSPPPNSSDTISTAVSPVATITSSSPLISFALPPTISTSSTTTTSPTSTDCMNSISASIITHPDTPGPADISVPSTSSSETDTTSTTTTSLNRADTTSTTSSATTAAICSPLMTDSDPPYTNNVSTTLTTTIDNSSATSTHLTSPAPSNGRPVQDNDLKTSPEERSSVEPAEKGTADEELAMVLNSEQTEMDESKKVGNGGEKSENENEKPTLTSDSEVIIKEVQKESVKPELDTMKSEVGMAEPTSGKDDELCSDKGEMEGQKQEEVDK